MTSSSSSWLSFEQAWNASPWTAKELRTFVRKGVLQSREVDGHMMFEPEGFFMAVREELALSGGLSSHEVATHFHISHDALIKRLDAGDLYAYHTDLGWYLEPEEFERVPALFPDALIPTPGQPSHRSPHELRENVQADVTPRQPSLPLSQTRIEDSPEPVQRELALWAPSSSSPKPPPPASQPRCTSPGRWLTFKDAVRQSAFTHQELHQAVRTGSLVHTRNAQGRLVLERQSFRDLHPPSTWQPLERDGETGSSPQRRQVLKQLWSGQLKGRLMGGIWYVAPRSR